MTIQEHVNAQFKVLVDGESADRRETASWLLVVTPSDTERHHLHFYNLALPRPDEIREILSHY